MSDLHGNWAEEAQYDLITGYIAKYLSYCRFLSLTKMCIVLWYHHRIGRNDLTAVCTCQRAYAM